MLFNQLQNETNLTNSEKEIARYLLNQNLELATLSAQKLGDCDSLKNQAIRNLMSFVMT